MKVGIIDSSDKSRELERALFTINKFKKMQNLPSEERPSTKLLKDLYKNRKKLIQIESSNEPYVSSLRPLLRKDYWLSHALIKFLNYEYNLGIKIKNKKTENKSAIEKLKEMQSKLAENINCEEEEKDLF